MIIFLTNPDISRCGNDRIFNFGNFKAIEVKNTFKIDDFRQLLIKYRKEDHFSTTNHSNWENYATINKKDFES